MSRWWWFAILAIVTGRLVFFLEPHAISVDESTYLAIAEAWDHYGNLYVDSIDRKPPLLYALYFAIGKIFGFWNIHGPHLIAVGATLVLAWLADKIARNRMPQLPSGFAAFLMALISATFSREFVSANSELFLMIPMAAAFLILAKDESRVESFWPWFLAFALAGVSSLFKQTGAIVLVASGFLITAHFLFQRKFNAALKIPVAGILSSLVVIGLALVPFWLHGTLTDMLRWSVFDNFSYVKDAQHLKTSRPLLTPILISMAVWPLFWMGSLQSLKQMKSNPLLFLFLGGILGSIAFISVGGRLYSHYFVPLSFFLAIAGAPSIFEWYRKKPKLILAAAILPFLVCFQMITFRDFWSEYLPAHSFNKTMLSRISKASAEIKNLSQPSDRMAVWGMASQFYVLSERGSGTRFIPADYASGRLAGFGSGVKVESPGNQALYLNDLKTKAPKIFLDTSSAGLNDYQYFPISDYPEIFDYISRNYQKAVTVEGFDIWIRRDETTNEEKAPSP